LNDYTIEYLCHGDDGTNDELRVRTDHYSQRFYIQNFSTAERAIEEAHMLGRKLIERERRQAMIKAAINGGGA